MFSPYDDDDDDGDDDDDDVDIADDTKVSFLSLFSSPLENVWQVTTVASSSDARHLVFGWTCVVFPAGFLVKQTPHPWYSPCFGSLPVAFACCSKHSSNKWLPPRAQFVESFLVSADNVLMFSFSQNGYNIDMHWFIHEFWLRHEFLQYDCWFHVCLHQSQALLSPVFLA